MSDAFQSSPSPQGRQLHPDFVGLRADDAKYQFSAEFSVNCHALFNLEAPAVPGETVRTQERLRAAILNSIQTVVPEHSSPSASHFHVIAVGMETEVRVEGMPSKQTIVPFVATTAPLDNSEANPQPASLALGIFFPQIGSFTLSAVGTPISPISDRAAAGALVPAIQWVELIERLDRFSHSIKIDALRLIYEGNISPQLSAATGTEVLQEARSRTLRYFDDAFKYCSEHSISISPHDVYRGIKAGVVANSPQTEPIFAHFENAREASRIIAEPHLRLSHLLSKRIVWLAPRYSIRKVKLLEPLAEPLMQQVGKGLAALRTISIGEGSPLSKAESLVSKIADAVESIKDSPSARSAGGSTANALNVALKHLLESKRHLLELESSVPTPLKNPRISYLDTVISASGAERELAQAAYALRVLSIDGNGVEDNPIEGAYFHSVEALRLLRGAFNRCLPGLLEFPKAKATSNRTDL